jgi:tRNA-specific 2-thiouridylase
VVDESGTELGSVEAVEMVTIGQRRGLRLAGGAPKQFVLDVDVETRTVVVGAETSLQRSDLRAERMMWSHEPLPIGSEVMVQTSAHGATQPALIEEVSSDTVLLQWREPQRRTAPGQSVVLYDASDRAVLAGGIVC